MSDLYARLPALDWGRGLDASAGLASLTWLSAQPAASWTALTPNPETARRLQTACPEVRVVPGEPLGTDLEGPFDTVFSDGALSQVERYAPYRQSEWLARLAALGSTVVLLAREPWPLEGGWSSLVQLRDASYLLAGFRHPRDFPLDWVTTRLEEQGLRIRLSERLATVLGTPLLTDLERSIGANLAALAGGELRDRLSGQLQAALKTARSRLGQTWGAEYWLVAERK